MLQGERDKLLQMEEQLAKNVIGQGDAIHAVSNAVRRSRAGLQDSDRPLGSFLFLGPTGVGKTELTKTLANLGRYTSVIDPRFWSFRRPHRTVNILSLFSTPVSGTVELCPLDVMESAI
jgi:flagellar biosynthesis GTPase FlhF